MSGDGPILYLAYGSNLHPHRLDERIGEVVFHQIVHLPGWRLCFDKRGSDGSAKANLRPAPGSDQVAWAAVYGVRTDQWLLLDHFEGCGGGYETFRFDVLIEDKPRMALAYLTPSQWTTNKMQPFDWYRDLVLAGAQFHGLPERYCKMIASQPAVRDPDPVRAEVQAKLLAEMA